MPGTAGSRRLINDQAIPRRPRLRVIGSIFVVGGMTDDNGSYVLSARNTKHRWLYPIQRGNFVRSQPRLHSIPRRRERQSQSRETRTGSRAYLATPQSIKINTYSSIPLEATIIFIDTNVWASEIKNSTSSGTTMCTSQFGYDFTDGGAVQ